ncbi:hypothetical protein EYF80_053593 [Liparis tanakae]|uniref:Uncharacterized protein n=1 Tax=Liparis tanakae TaxID=230148 RepID=A0A4Z2F4U9_9TELE|nr:hypothetical protein EYF80_053593 [Liparis tanakae]
MDSGEGENLEKWSTCSGTFTFTRAADFTSDRTNLALPAMLQTARQQPQTDDYNASDQPGYKLRDVKMHSAPCWTDKATTCNFYYTKKRLSPPASAHFPARWFSSLAGSHPGNISGFSASVARTFFFSLNLPEWDTLTWRPLLAAVLSTILSSRASSRGSSSASTSFTSTESFSALLAVIYPVISGFLSTLTALSCPRCYVTGAVSPSH